MFFEPGYRNRNPQQTQRRAFKWIALTTVMGAVAITTFPAVTHAAERPNAAHSLAEKFATGSGNGQEDASKPDPARNSDGSSAAPRTQVDKSKDDQRRAQADRERRIAEEQRAYEEDMLSRARAEAEARLKAEMAHEQDVARERAEAEAQARQKAAAEAQKSQAIQRAETEAATQRAEQAKQAENEALQKAEAENMARERESEARALAQRLRAARFAQEDARARATAEAEAKAQDDARMAQARNTLRQRTERLAGKLGAIQSRREMNAQAQREQLTTGATHSANKGEGAAVAVAGEMYRLQPAASVTVNSNDVLPHRATVLLVMKPGNRGIRRWNKTADPMLCIEENCYISNGADNAANRVTRRKGFGPGIALGSRAGACNNQLACVFRDVDLVNDTAWLQPIDLRIVRHDRREARRISIDPTCAVSRGRIACSRMVESDDYRAWIIPEHVARQAGSDVLKTALENSLQGNLVAHSPQ